MIANLSPEERAPVLVLGLAALDTLVGGLSVRRRLLWFHPVW